MNCVLYLVTSYDSDTRGIQYSQPGNQLGMWYAPTFQSKCCSFYSYSHKILILMIGFLLFQIKLTAQEEVALELRASQVMIYHIMIYDTLWPFLFAALLMVVFVCRKFLLT